MISKHLIEFNGKLVAGPVGFRPVYTVTNDGIIINRRKTEIRLVLFYCDACLKAGKDKIKQAHDDLSKMMNDLNQIVNRGD